MTFHCTSLTIVAFSCGIPGAADLAHKGHCFSEYQQFHIYTHTCKRSNFQQKLYISYTAPTWILLAVR
jgi:hypothetical protein